MGNLLRTSSLFKLQGRFCSLCCRSAASSIPTTWHLSCQGRTPPASGSWFSPPSATRWRAVNPSTVVASIITLESAKRSSRTFGQANRAAAWRGVKPNLAAIFTSISGLPSNNRTQSNLLSFHEATCRGVRPNWSREFTSIRGWSNNALGQKRSRKKWKGGSVVL